MLIRVGIWLSHVYKDPSIRYAQNQTEHAGSDKSRKYRGNIDAQPRFSYTSANRNAETHCDGTVTTRCRRAIFVKVHCKCFATTLVFGPRQNVLALVGAYYIPKNVEAIHLLFWLLHLCV